jgi:O-antigen/teichoic acid export membrane protein
VVWSLQIVSGSLVSPILAHLLGPSEFGILAAVIALHQVLTVVAVFGIDQALVQQRAEDDTDTVARRLITAGTAYATILTIALGLTIPWWGVLLGFEGYSSLLTAAVLWTAPGAAVQLMLALLLSQDRFRAFAMVSCLSAVGGQVFGIALLFTHGRSAGIYAWGGVISQCAGMLLGVVLTRPAVRGALDWQVTRRAVQLGLPITISGLFLFVLNAGDRVVIQRLLGPSEVGRYQVAYTVGYVVVIVIGLVGQAWMPRIVEIRDLARRLRLTARSRDELYRLLMPIVLGITLGAPVALRIVAPPSFMPDSLVVVVFLVALSAFPVAASGATGRLLIADRRARPLAVIAGVAAVVNVVLNFLLLPVMGIAGAALATLVAFGLQALLQRRAVPCFPRLPRTPPRVAGEVVVCVSLSFVSVWPPQNIPWNVLRFALALLCLAWFVLALRRARATNLLASETAVRA